MIGAIIGDIVGSRFEWNNIKSKDFEFLTGQTGFAGSSARQTKPLQFSSQYRMEVAAALLFSSGGINLHFAVCICIGEEKMGCPEGSIPSTLGFQ